MKALSALLGLALAALCAVVLCFSSACATPDDFRALEQAATERDAELESARIDFERGLATQEETAARVEAAVTKFAKAAETAAENVAARTKDGLDALDPETLGIQALMTALGLWGLNKHRNKTRDTDPRVANRARV